MLLAATILPLSLIEILNPSSSLPTVPLICVLINDQSPEVYSYTCIEPELLALTSVLVEPIATLEPSLFNATEYPKTLLFTVGIISLPSRPQELLDELYSQTST